MTQPRPDPQTDAQDTARRDGKTQESPANQPAPTGAANGSPAAPAMKQFQKTQTESGRS